jgi:uncharacterized protein YxjI
MTEAEASADASNQWGKRFHLHKKVFPPKDSFRVFNSEGKLAYVARFKSLGLIAEISLRDAQDQELAFVRQKLWALGANYGIYRQGRLWVTLKRTFSLSVRDHFTVSEGEQEQLEIFCKIIDEGFEFYRSGNAVARVARKHLTWNDKMEIRLAETEDEVLILACTLAVYSAHH